MYKARLLRSTGFNAVNIPETLSVLIASASSYDDVELTITSPILSALSLPITFDALCKVDYVIIWKGTEGQDDFALASEYYCYFADASRSIPQATDVYMLPVVPDFLTMIGIDNIKIIDGITTRSTYALNNADPNKLTSGDPYLAPSETMILITEWIGEGDDYEDYIESTIDIVETAHADNAATASSSMGDVTYPIPEYADNKYFTPYILDDNPNKIITNPGSMIIAYNKGQTTIALLQNEVIKQGLAKIRGMGLESAILHCYKIPRKYATPSFAYDDTYPDGSTHQWVQQMTGKWSTQQTAIDLKQLDDTNDRIAGVLNFSEYTKYGIMAASGESIEADPKDLMTTSNPVIKMVGDPRPDGRPYFRFEKINNTNVSNTEFFRNCIAGLPWKQTQLVFTEASGNALNTARYQASRNMADLALSQAQRGFGLQKEFLQQNYDLNNSRIASDLALGIGSGITGSIDTVRTAKKGQEDTIGSFSGFSAGGILALGGAATNAIYSHLDNEMTRSQGLSSLAYNQLATVENYAAQKQADALSYGIQQNVQVPSVMFPFNTETLRDFYGNGVLVYRFWYSSDDLSRIGRIIRAYGVKYTMKSVKAHFIPEQGSSYCYVEASGVTLADLPQWQANGASLQLQNGVRIWNTKPDVI